MQYIETRSSSQLHTPIPVAPRAVVGVRKPAASHPSVRSALSQVSIVPVLSYGFTTSLDGTLVKKYRQRHLLRCKLWGVLVYVLMTCYAEFGRLAYIVGVAGHCQKWTSGAVGIL